VTPGAFVSELQRTAGEPHTLEVVRPTLEDIYLGLIRQHDAAALADALADDSRIDLKEPA
jgi:ABC-2 type transport system ATP-binding protein